MTDVRYANEASMVRALGGVVVRVDRPNVAAGVGASHSSEALAFETDYVLTNDTTLLDLAMKVEALVKRLQRTPCTT